MSGTNLVSIMRLGNSSNRNVSQKSLTLAVAQLIELLRKEVAAKNAAYLFITKKGLMADFINGEKD